MRLNKAVHNKRKHTCVTMKRASGEKKRSLTHVGNSFRLPMLRATGNKMRHITHYLLTLLVIALVRK